MSQPDPQARRRRAEWLPAAPALNSLLAAVLERWRRLRALERELEREFRHQNLRRLRLAAALLLPLNLMHVLVFQLVVPDQGEPGARWQVGITLGHVAMATLMATAGLAAHALLARPGHDRAERLLVDGSLALLLGFAGAFAVIDQRVTPAITPALIGSLGVGLVFLLRPPLALGLYTCIGLLVSWGLGLTQSDPAMLLSNRVNVLTGSMMAAALSMLLWHKSATNAVLSRELRESNLTLRQQQHELQRLATHDGLTGLINRREFDRLLRAELVRGSRIGTPTAVVSIDLDHFKRINDAHGHPAGDAVLQQVARHMHDRLRAYDLLARYGGEEFMLMLPDTSMADARVVADKLRLSVEQLPLQTAGQTLQVTASLGVAASSADVHSLEQLYEHADRALYAAKQQGRNRVCVVD